MTRRDRGLAVITAATSGTPLTDAEGRALWWLAGQDPDVVSAVVAALTRAGRDRAAEQTGRRRTSPRAASIPSERRAVNPALSRRRTTSRREYQRWEAYADDYAMLARGGYPLDVAAARLGLSFDALEKALERHHDDPRARRPVTAR